MKKKISIIVNDIHLSIDNYLQRENLFNQIFRRAVDEKISNIILLGDIFQSRIAQRLEVLNSFGRILQQASTMDLEITCIPGNHDKTNYESYDSFLDQYKYHTNFWLFEKPFTTQFTELPDIKIVFMPFFKEEMWHDLYLKQVEGLENNNNILFTHIAVNGSVNNDGSAVRSNLTQDLFKKHFKAVFSGHYHDHQTIGIFHHLPSICQSNYGENELKGFTILYDDLSYEIVQLDFDKYLTIKIDLNKISKKNIQKEIDKYKDSYKFLRVEFLGDESQLKSIDKKVFTSQGVDVKFKQFSVQEEELKAEFVKFNSSSIIDEFAYWCEKEDKDYNQGITYLKNKLS